MKSFPIKVHHDQSPAQPEAALTRRHLLKGSGVLMGTLAVGSPLALLAPSTAWALELKSLSKAQGETLLRMGQVLFPHSKLPDAVYALLAKDLDADAAKDAGTAKLLSDGIAALNHVAGGSFLKANAARRLQVRYLLWGPREIAKWPASTQPWSSCARLIGRAYNAGTLYDISSCLLGED